MRQGRRPPNYGRTYPAEVLSADEVGRLLDACLLDRWHGPVPLRNRAMIVLLWRCGLRTQEALDLYPHDIDLAGATLHVRRSKTRAGLRKLGLDERTREELAHWMSVRARLEIPEPAPYICTTQGRPVLGTVWRDTIKVLAKRAAIEKRVHSHGLRHTFASERLREGAVLPVLSRQMGHAGLRSTMPYLKHAWDEEIVETMASRQW